MTVTMTTVSGIFDQAHAKNEEYQFPKDTLRSSCRVSWPTDSTGKLQVQKYRRE